MQAFDCDAALKDHTRLPEGCELRNEEPLEGFDTEQERRLRSRKKGALGDTKEDQWKEAYLILFPDTLVSEIPSPYYDYGEDMKMQQSPTSAGFARYEAYLSRELPISVRHELEVAMEEELGPIEERLKGRLESIVRACQERIFKQYQDAVVSKVDDDPADDLADHPADGEEDEITCEPGPSSQANVPTICQPQTEVADLSAYEMPPEVPFQSWDNFTGSFGAAMGGHSDSGYGSAFTDPSWLPYAFENSIPSIPSEAWAWNYNTKAPEAMASTECDDTMTWKGKGKARAEE